jgi:uncharacterized protein (UPF0216 family)
MGGVSISNQFSDFSKSLMIEFMKSHYYDPYIAQYVHPKKEYKVKLKDADKDFVFNETEADLNKFDKIIDEVEPGSLRLPVLIKKYIKQQSVMAETDPQYQVLEQRIAERQNQIFKTAKVDVPEVTPSKIPDYVEPEKPGMFSRIFGGSKPAAPQNKVVPFSQLPS